MIFFRRGGGAFLLGICDFHGVFCVVLCGHNVVVKCNIVVS
jgi:hypothetical protein